MAAFLTELCGVSLQNCCENRWLYARCIIAVDLFGPAPKVLSTPRRQASEKLDVPAEVRPTQITEERFFRLLLRRVSSFFFARIRDRSENTGDTFFYFFFL